MIASITRIGLGKTFVSSLNRIACDRNQKSGNMPREITLIPTLKSLLSLMSNPLQYFFPF